MRKLLKASATFWIIAANVIFFFAALILGYFHPSLMDMIALKPHYIMQGKYLWTILTSMFMHASPFHLFANMLSLLFLGSFLERLIGKKRFLWIYFISGIIGAIFYVLLSFFGNPDVPAVGASGAIFGIAGMLAVLTPKMPVYVMFIPIAMPMWFGVILIMAVLWLLSISVGLPVGNTAHLGGLITGMAYASYLRHKYRTKADKIRRYFS